MIVADTGAILALIDADDRHHTVLAELFDDDPSAWVVPWVVLPEIDYLVLRHIGSQAERAFVSDLTAGAYVVEWAEESDFERALALIDRYESLQLGLVDAVVMAMTERLRAQAIATLDVRDFGAVKLRGNPKLFPRDL